MELTTVLIISVLSLAFAVWLTTNVLKNDTGTAEMQVISNAIKEGAEAFLRRQYKTITVLSVVFAAIIFILYGFIRAHNPADPVRTGSDSIGSDADCIKSDPCGALYRTSNRRT